MLKQDKGLQNARKNGNVLKLYVKELNNLLMWKIWSKEEELK